VPQDLPGIPGRRGTMALGYPWYNGIVVIIWRPAVRVDVTLRKTITQSPLFGAGCLPHDSVALAHIKEPADTLSENLHKMLLLST
jgi:hypothetical protein